MPANRITGTAGNDFLFGTNDDDFIYGDAGDDEIRSNGGHDTLVGGQGNDTLVGDDGFFVDAGADLLIGGEGDDWLAYIRGDDTMIGGEGNDFFEVWATDTFDHVVVQGGDGVDTMFLVLAAPAVINLQEGTLTTTSRGAPASMSLHGIENVQAFSSDGIQITGNSADNRLETGNGDDTLNGGKGRDFLWGSSQNDLYILDAPPGEEHADEILYEKYSADVHGWDENDRLALDNDVMRELGAEGTFSEGDARFYAAAGASGGADDDDRVIYDTDSGRLYYDADGSGDGAAQLVAVVNAVGHDLAATDILVI